jgi:hypothetical protein
MKIYRDIRIPWTSLVGAALLTVLLFASMPAAAQDKAAAAGNGPCIGCSVDGKTTPRTADGHPNLNGFWGGNAGGGGASTRQFERGSDGSILFDFGTDFNDRSICNDDSCIDPNEPPYKPEYLEKVKKISATYYGGTTPLDPQMDCRPLGIPRTGIGGMQIVQTPEAIAILYEGAPYSTFRLIFTDGRQHPKDLDTTFMGDSIGHWDGDTLVVDVTGLNDETWLAGGVGNRIKYGNIHSDQEHVIERWTRKGDVLTYEATVEDPVMFTKPWVITPRRVQHAGRGDSSIDGLLETICTPDKAHFVPPSPNDVPSCNYRCSDVAPKK